MTANWTKDKRSGSWVVLAAVAPGDSLPDVGDEITVTKKDGSTQTVTAARVSRSFTGKYGDTKGLDCAFVTPEPRERDGNGGGTYERAYTAPGRCKADGCGATAGRSGYCRQCEFDEYDN